MRKLAIFLLLSAALVSAQKLTKTEKTAPYERGTCCAAEFDDYSNATAHLLLEEDFTALENQAERERSTKARFKGGVWKLRAFYSGLENPMYKDTATEQQWKEHLGRLKRWSDAHPESVTAKVALAHAYLNHGWKARGGGYANTVSEEGWDGFADGGKKASQILMEAAKLKQKDPDFFYAVIRVAQVQGWDPEVARAAVDQEIALEPGYYYPYRMYAMYMLPKWYGEPGDAARFATEVADKIGGKLGDAMYAEIASRLYCGCGGDSDVHMSFERIVRGTDSNEELNGTSLEKLNKLAYIAAASMQNAPVAKQVFDRLGDNWDRETWRKKDIYDMYRRWSDGEMTRRTATK